MAGEPRCPEPEIHMIRSPLKVMTVAAALILSLTAAAYAQNFFFRTKVTGSTATPTSLLTLVSGSGLGMQLDAAGAEPGSPVNGEVRTLTYRNEVSREITVTVNVSPTQDNFEIVSDGCSGTVAIGAQCSVQVRFRASEDGDYTGTLNLSAS